MPTLFRLSNLLRTKTFLCFRNGSYFVSNVLSLCDSCKLSFVVSFRLLVDFVSISSSYIHMHEAHESN
jgi:hypothetical protein